MQTHRWYLLSLFVLGNLVYSFNLNGPLFYDDIEWIVNNPPIHALTWENISYIFTHDSLSAVHLISYYYRPLMFTVFALIYNVSGTDPFLYHLVNNLFHIGTGILLYVLLFRWLGKKRVAFIASLLFIIHPLQTEAVAYVSGLGDPLNAFLVLLGLLFYTQKRPVLAGVCMILGVFVREVAIAFPLYLGIILVCFELKGSFWNRFKRAFVRVLPYVGIGILYSLFRTGILHIMTTTILPGAEDMYATHILYRVFTFFHALAVYLHLIFFPIGLHMNRSIPISTSLGENFSWVGALFVCVSVGILVTLYIQKKWEIFYVWFFGLGFYFVYLSMTSGILRPLNAVIYEHWLYFALIGFFTILAWYLDKAWVWCESKGTFLRSVWIVFLSVYALFLGYQTIERNLTWADPVALYKNILVYEPENTQAITNLGEWYYRQHEDAEAERLFMLAIDINPDDPLPYNSLGYGAVLQGKDVVAEAYFKKAMEIDPQFDPAYYNLASLYVTQEKYTEAQSVLEQLQSIHPSPDTAEFIQYAVSLQITSSTAPTVQDGLR